MFTKEHTWVICAYGESEYLESCIQSLKSQDLHSQIICYSSTPLESIQGLCRAYDIPFFTSDGGGIGKDWNAAMSCTQTRFVTIAHQDDIYEPDYLHKILDKMDSSSLIAFSDYVEEKQGIRIPANLNLKIKRMMLGTLAMFPFSRFWRNRVLSLGNPICCPAVTYNRELLADFVFDEQMKVSLDWYAWYQISQYDGKFTYLPEKLMCHRIHQDSETSKTIADQSRTKEDLFMYSLFWPKWIATIINKFYAYSQKSND